VAQKSDLPPYPLQQVLEIKKKRVDDAEKVVREKLRLLKEEEDKLAKRKEERDKVKRHYDDKLNQLRHSFDEGTTSDKIDQKKNYIKVVQERLKVEEKKVKEQQQQVEMAEKNVELAKNALKDRKKEQQKIETHQEVWTKDTLKEVDIIQTREEDEIGSTMFLSKLTKTHREKRDNRR
jgi:hypothetical protein